MFLIFICPLIMCDHHLIFFYFYFFSLFIILYMWVYVCTFMCINLFSCPSPPWIFSLMYCCCVSIIFVNCICPPGALIWLINLFLFLLNSNMFSPWYSWTIAIFVVNNDHSLFFTWPSASTFLVFHIFFFFFSSISK
jgi:hypothetical protein